jgi:multiple sugar transport system substrate-binding protein
MSLKPSRRDFLKTSALLASGATLAACAPAATQAPAAATQPAAATTAPQAAAPAAGTKKIVFSTYVWSNFEQAMGEILNGWKAATPGVDFEAQFIPQTVDYWAKIQTQVAGGTSPDLGMADFGRLVSWAKNGTLLDITPYISSSKFPVDKEIPGAIAQYRWADGEFNSGATNGKYYGLPSDAQCWIFAYNKKMFDDAGVSYPTDDWTWDDVLAAAKKITKADANKWGILTPTDGLSRGNLVFSAGGSSLSSDFTKSMLADPATIDAYKWCWDLVYTHKVAPPSGAVGQQNPFMSGQVAMTIQGIWVLTDYAAIKEFEWDIAMQPKHPKTGKQTTSMESDGWWLYKGAKEPDTAFNLISYLAAPAGQKLFISANDCIPSTFQEVAQDWYATKPPEHKMKALDNINKDSQMNGLTCFEFATMSNAFQPIIDKAFADGTDITAAMKDADKVLTEELAKAWALLKA